eukprot:TRINITY_DN5732_c0_g1_i1.p1 TRINITY_DN5732_c0_g1~~TRINITY_DN5732_c0_g1_i1.p1  ORF type:complete len:871 (-),score=283.65 TRINITY_DN5732_c0_g1_i1:326-2938(-)
MSQKDTLSKRASSPSSPPRLSEEEVSSPLVAKKRRKTRGHDENEEEIGDHRAASSLSQHDSLINFAEQARNRIVSKSSSVTHPAASSSSMANLNDFNRFQRSASSIPFSSYAWDSNYSSPPFRWQHDIPPSFASSCDEKSNNSLSNGINRLNDNKVLEVENLIVKNQIQSSFAKRMARILKDLDSKGEFTFGSRLNSILPGLRIDPLGNIALPLLPPQAQSIVNFHQKTEENEEEKQNNNNNNHNTNQSNQKDKYCVLLPFDKTNDNKHQFHIENPEWEKIIEEAVSQVTNALDLEGKIDVDLDKMVLYGPGYQSSKGGKEERYESQRFGTLLILFPSEHVGGEFTVSYGNEKKSFGFGNNTLNSFHFLFYFNDCELDVEEIESGYRLGLYYNLNWKNGSPVPVPRDADYCKREISRMGKEWSNLGKRDVEKLVYVLEENSAPVYPFSTAEFSPNDRKVCDLLMECLPQQEFELFFGNLTKTQVGLVEGIPDFHYVEGGGNAKWRILRLDQESYSLNNLYDLSSGFRSGSLSIEEIEILNNDLAASSSITDEIIQTTEGFQTTRCIKRVALMFWPKSHSDLALFSFGDEVVMNHWNKLYDWFRQNPAFRAEAIEFTRTIISKRIRLLPPTGAVEWLFYFHDVDLVNFYLSHWRSPIPGIRAIPQLSADFGWDILIPHIRNWFEEISVVDSSDWAATVGYFLDFIAIKDDSLVRRNLHEELVLKFLQILANIPPERSRPADLIPLMIHLEKAGLDEELNDLCISMSNAWKGESGVRNHLMPMCRFLHQILGSKAWDNPSYALIYYTVLAFLTKSNLELRNTALNPNDWTLTVRLPVCDCLECVELNKFLVHPTEKELMFRGTEAIRNHITR